MKVGRLVFKSIFEFKNGWWIRGSDSKVRYVILKYLFHISFLKWVWFRCNVSIITCNNKRWYPINMIEAILDRRYHLFTIWLNSPTTNWIRKAIKIISISVQHTCYKVFRIFTFCCPEERENKSNITENIEASLTVLTCPQSRWYILFIDLVSISNVSLF